MPASANQNENASRQTSSSWVDGIITDLKNSPGRVQLIVVVLLLVTALFALRSFAGHDLYVLEPGLDQGLVYARLYSWWGLSSQSYELKRFKDDDGYMTWHVRKQDEGSQWQRLYGPDPDGGLSMWFPR